MIYFFRVISHTKVAKIVLPGEPDNSKPFGLLLKGFFLFMNYLSGKEGFLKKFVVLEILKYIQT